MKYQTATKSQLWKTVKELEETVSIQKTLISSLEEDLQEIKWDLQRAKKDCTHVQKLVRRLDDHIDEKSEIAYKQEIELKELKETVEKKDKAIEDLQKRLSSEEATTQLLRKGKLAELEEAKAEITDLKDEIKTLKSSEKMAWKKVEKANKRETDLSYSNNDYEDRIAEANSICWSLYDRLQREEEITIDMIGDTRLLIGLLHPKV